MTYNTANLIIAMTALPAEIMMIYYLLKEQPLNSNARGTRKILTILFFSVFLASFCNTLYYLFRTMQVISNHPAANIKSLFSSLMLSFIAWLFLIYVSRKDRDDKIINKKNKKQK